MYSKEIHDAILKTYKSVDAYESTLKRVAEPFVLPMDRQIKLHPLETVEDIFARLAATSLSTDDNGDLWVLGAYRGSHLALDSLAKLMKAVEPLGKRITLYLQGDKKAVPAGIVHPRYLRLLDDDEPSPKRIKLPESGKKFPYYEPNTPNMVESVMIYDHVAKTWELKGMVFGFSNFTPLPAPIKLMDAFRLVYLDSFCKMLLVNAYISSPEHLIQLLKVAASLSPEYQLTDEAECEASLKARMAQLKDLGFEFGLCDDGTVNRGAVKWMDTTAMRYEEKSFDTYREMNTFINLELWEMTRNKEATPALLKKVGNAAGLNAEKYFACMNGQPCVSAYNVMGNNARLMAAGLLLRLHAGDEELANLLKFCKEHSVRVYELAVHDGFPDLFWGQSPGYPRMSPMGHLVTSETPAYNAFGNGVNSIIDAMKGVAAAQCFLGFVLGNTLSTPEEIRDGAAAAFRRMLNVLD